MLLTRLHVRSFGATTDPDAIVWRDAVIGIGGTTSPATLSAVSNFAKSAKSAGYWDKLNRVNLLCGDQLAAALVPLKVGGGAATDTNVNFVSDDYSEATGLTGNGTTKYLRTGLIPSASLSLNDQHWALYNRSSSASGASAHITMGAFDGTRRIEFDAPFSDGLAYVQISAATQLSHNPAEPYGFMLATRVAADSTILYRNGSSIASTNAASTGLPTVEAYVMGMNNSGAVAFPGGGPCGGYSIGAGLTATEVENFAAHMEAFQDAIGRGVA